MATPPQDELDAFLRSLRQAESSNNYTAESPWSSASGAYQYIDSTWDNYGGYARAKDAPQSVQDERARRDIANSFERFGNWEQVAANHMYPAWADDPSKWNQVAAPGNPPLQEYVNKVVGGMGGASSGSGSGSASGSSGSDPVWPSASPVPGYQQSADPTANLDAFVSAFLSQSPTASPSGPSSALTSLGMRPTLPFAVGSEQDSIREVGQGGPGPRRQAEQPLGSAYGFDTLVGLGSPGPPGGGGGLGVPSGPSQPPSQGHRPRRPKSPSDVLSERPTVGGDVR